ncbi:MAG TPA: hypothetical protein IAC96_04785 [Candidatus Fimimorpha faecalis]|mgnify:CR=1 FL=1|uniref:Uncharacterized protein n=1 Tax=Candidatus Fimimorpha faecalis TaxID=2840824 RepID=A0A9D1EDC5_9FIRM|nr:hypothetical protein [Candidatus Fimimorpha faecalis]
MVKVNILRKEDEVLNVTSEFVAVKRRNGEVDIIPFVKGVQDLRLDFENRMIIGYGKNTIHMIQPDSDVVITTF